MSGYKIKPWEELTITDDYMFKLVMRHKRFCKRLIERILNIKIREINYLEEEKSFKFKYDSKGIRLDVYVEGDDTIYDIEMQVRDYGDQELASRSRYYQSMIDMDSLARGALYKELRSSIIIFLCPFPLFHKDRHIYTFRNLCCEDTTLELNDGATKIFLSSQSRSSVPLEGAEEGSSLSEKEPSRPHLPSLGVTGLFCRFKTVSVRQLQHFGGMYYEGDV